ncbi:MAG TPA: Lpg1974 family pore-forming outer membrane protein [Gammaproteobacteria bacterium]|nr:Lpg1974 family pore-forming outer membrane protein [Gammaproteobacteria bacterium]
MIDYARFVRIQVGVALKQWVALLLGCIYFPSAFAGLLPSPSKGVYADLLVWQLREGSADDWAQLITPAGTQQSAQLVDVPFTWNPGLRLGGFYQSEDEHWRANAYITTYHTTGSNTASGQVYSALLGNFYAGNTNGLKFGPYYDFASMRWEYAFDNVDMELGRLFKISEQLTFTPYVGLKAAFIDQSMLTHWVNPHSPNTPPNTYTFTSSNENLKNNYWGLGPAVGVNALFNFMNASNHHLGVFADVSGAVMFGHWTFSDVFVTNDHQTVNVNTDPITGGSTMWRGQVGFAWQHTTSAATYSAKLAYEAQTWFNQLQYYSYSMGHLNDLMSLHGGDFELGVAFL